MAAPVPQTFGALTGAERTTAQIPVPASVANTDIIVIGLYKESTAAVTPASGFTLKTTVNCTGAQLHDVYLYWKRATGADTGTYDFSWTGTAWAEAKSMRISGAVLTGDPFGTTINTATSNSGSSSNTTPAVATLTPSLNDCLVFFFGTNFDAGANWTPPTNFTERGTDGMAITLGTWEQSTATATGSVTAQATNAALGRTGLVAFILPLGVIITPTVVAGVATVPAITFTSAAAITATVVAGVGTVPAVTVLTPVPAVRVAGVATIPAPTVTTGSTVIATVVAGTATIPAPTTTAGSTVVATTVAAVATVPAVIVQTAGNATVVATVVDGVAAVPAVTVALGVAIGATVVAGTATVPAVTVFTGSTITVSAVAGAVSIPTPTVVPETTVGVSTVAGSTSIPAVAISTGVALSPSVVAAAGSIPDPFVIAGQTPMPHAVDGVTTIPAPTVTTGSSATPASVSAAASVPDVLVQLSVVIEAAAVALAASVPTPVISLSRTADVAAVAALASVPAPTVTAGTGTIAAPVLVLATGSVPAVSVAAGAGTIVAPSRVLGRTTIPYPVIESTPPVTPDEPVQTGGWYSLLDIYLEAAAWMAADKSTPPVACPNDGEPLRSGPHGELYCPYDGWQPS